MSEERQRPSHITPIHLTEEELTDRLPKMVGRVRLDYSFYPGQDLYSDGEIEEELLKIVKDVSRVEYPSVIEQRKSWPILYHLSPLRGNIVDWFPFGKEAKVLEIGSGCGAITEKLSQKAGSITCVELSARRSLINAYRNQDRDNVMIHVGNFSDIEPSLDRDYDVACMIGVFEYGRSYIHTEHPYEDFLDIIKRHVKNNGCIIIAIENRLGMKYWAGCKEDHLGSYFSGLEGYPGGGNACTFSRSGLERIFQRCGISEYSFYYPYPDYKFPTTLYSDSRLPNPGELTDNMRNFDRDRMVLFNEKYVYDGIIRDGLFDVFANSYLVVLGKQPDIRYVKYSNDRADAYGLRTEILNEKIVRKLPLCEEAKEHVKGMQRSCELLTERFKGSGLRINPCKLAPDGSYAEFPFEQGKTLEELLDECLDRDDLEGFYRLFDKYWQLVSYGEEKPIADYDMIFANILVDGDTWTAIDYEWTVERQVPAKEIAFRAVYCYVLEEEKRNKLNLDLIMDKLGVTPQEAEDYREKEWDFQKQVTGKRKSLGEIRAMLGTYSVDPKDLMERHLQRILDQRIQIYYDRGAGFSEMDSVYIPDIYVDEHTMEVELELDGNVRNLRIDPADRPCMVKLGSLLLNGEAIPIRKNTLETNGKTVRQGCYVFATSDPNITIHVSQLPMRGENKVYIRLSLSPLPLDMAEDMAGAVKKLF